MAAIQVFRASIGSEMSEEWIDIVPVQRRAAGESPHKSWLAIHGLSEVDVANDVMLEIVEWWAVAISSATRCGLAAWPS